MLIKGIHIPILKDSAKYSGTTIFPFVFTKRNVSDVLLNHERIHLAQQAELFIILFYFLYFLFYLQGLLMYKDHDLAYHSIPFEVEAYTNQHNLEYLKTRKRLAWL